MSVYDPTRIASIRTRRGRLRVQGPLSARGHEEMLSNTSHQPTSMPRAGSGIGGTHSQRKLRNGVSVVLILISRDTARGDDKTSLTTFCDGLEERAEQRGTTEEALHEQSDRARKF
jgi:hypothetical protein